QGYTFLILQGDQFVPSNPPVTESAARANRTADATPTTNDTKKSYNRARCAVIVGINEYQNWPKLRYCVNDADAIEQMLINQYGFKRSNIIKLLNKEATRERIVWALGDQMSDPAKITKDDGGFVFFACHEATRQLTFV